MEDVTERALEGVNDTMADSDREEAIIRNMDAITSEAVAGTGYRAFVRPFYMGKQYFLFVNETIY